MNFRTPLRLAVLALSTSLLLACSQTPTAPDVQFTTIKGEKGSLSQLRGKVVLVNFWATSCSGCVAEMPKMVQTYQKYHGKGYEMVAMAMSYDRPDYVLNFAQTRQLPFKVTLDSDGKLVEAFGNQFGQVMATPTTFLLGKDGRLLQKYVGEPDFAAMHQLIEQELQRS